jgi:hypothetical protein
MPIYFGSTFKTFSQRLGEGNVRCFRSLVCLLTQWLVISSVGRTFPVETYYLEDALEHTVQSSLSLFLFLFVSLHDLYLLLLRGRVMKFPPILTVL